METKNSSITIADLCEQFKRQSVIVNRDYQRSSKVWPNAAKSYLIDTILSGYPIPKLAMYQKLDLANRRSTREIVDGQQRTLTIYEFYNDKFKLSGRTSFKGKTFSNLNDEEQRKFLEYGLSVDVFVGADEADIRQVFRRMNSYNVPLNPEEQRHAKYQGAFKWFIVELTEVFTQPLKNMGVFTESNISRMADSKFYAELIYAVDQGIDHSQDTKIDRIYDKWEENFPEMQDLRQKIGDVISWVVAAHPLYKTELTNSYVFYSLLLALWHRAWPVAALSNVYTFSNQSSRLSERDVAALLEVNELIVRGEGKNIEEREFLDGTSRATNRKTQREQRFKYLCLVLDKS